jgi:hypothetical protein
MTTRTVQPLKNGSAAPAPPTPRRAQRRHERSPIKTTSIHPKASAAILAGALVTALLAILSQFAGFDPNPPVVSAFTTLATFALMWLVPDAYWSRASAVSGS